MQNYINYLKMSEFYISEKIYSEKQLRDYEVKLDFNFTSTYKRFMKEVGSGYFSGDYNVMLPNGTSIQNFYPLKLIVELTRDFHKNEIPEESIPFGADNTGNIYCFRKEVDGVFFVDHGFNSVDKISEDFQSFLSLIKP